MADTVLHPLAAQGEGSIELSVVVPIYCESPTILELHQGVTAVRERESVDFELIFVDDGSSDESPLVLAGLVARDPRVCTLRLSRNFGLQAAVTAGLDRARGRGVLLM